MLAYRPIRSIANLNATLQEGLAAAQRVFSVLDESPKILEVGGARPLLAPDGPIKFDKVKFSYTAGGIALHGISLQVEAGQTAALVGPSGAGKSTLLNLIPRFYDVDEGRVVIGSQEIKTVSISSLRSSIALVSQDVVLFDDTIKANIAYGRSGAADKEIVEAAKLAAADGFIGKLPRGYDTFVGERGAKLSGGERQRIAIARALLKNAPILLLDEATASLDAESEREVQDALSALKNGRTTLVIAHRLATVRSADQIYVLEGGRVVESGSHEYLMGLSGLYSRLYSLQFSEDNK